MSNKIIVAENIAKQYRLGQVGRATLHNDINRWLHKAVGKADPYLKIGEENDRAIKGESTYVWALQDINFSVQQGEVLGIIGKNGAGKSTLLKILSKVTAPTKGTVKIKGRIASLLEVGTGFHPELSGRDNIYLNGAILGMRKKEITNKLDEIVAFAGVERYLDTPVKRYSSGMYVRLAFAVAAHLEPDILIVDEVLAVGDAEFQKKCLGKMKDVSEKDGRTVLFVSHNMQAVSVLTTKCLILSNGFLKYSGDTSFAISKYLNSEKQNAAVYIGKASVKKPVVTKVEAVTSLPNNIQQNGESMKLRFEITTPVGLKGAALSFQVINEYDIPVMHLWNFDSEISFCKEPGIYELICNIPTLHLYMGRYTLKVHFGMSAGWEKFEMLEGICRFEVVMYNKEREYTWVPNTCTYIEECTWQIHELTQHVS